MWRGELEKERTDVFRRWRFSDRVTCLPRTYARGRLGMYVARRAMYDAQRSTKHESRSMKRMEQSGILG